MFSMFTTTTFLLKWFIILLRRVKVRTTIERTVCMREGVCVCARARVCVCVGGMGLEGYYSILHVTLVVPFDCLALGSY